MGDSEASLLETFRSRYPGHPGLPAGQPAGLPTVRDLHLQDAPAEPEITDEVPLRQWSMMLLEYLRGERTFLDAPLDLQEQGTPFQRRVWKALQAIPYGETRSYQEVARSVGHPLASRAVGMACGANPIALVIPCHRVVRSDGKPGGYGGGMERKLALLELERRGAMSVTSDAYDQPPDSHCISAQNRV
ncbi:MAG: methylated-DNA--[protein]-cysteine S-methyltransferase [Chloroflexaceae bacterium]|nr:methylated-DNA--[protein]-cysteine S-methyltransferase [Chloroflexaceae bacterium]